MITSEDKQLNDETFDLTDNGEKKKVRSVRFRIPVCAFSKQKCQLHLTDERAVCIRV